MWALSVLLCVICVLQKNKPVCSSIYVYMYTRTYARTQTPLLEQGSVILGGREMKVSFALRQQYFHKCAMLLIHHNSGFSKAVILNRPTALVLPGMEEWGNVWFGGDVEDGGLFRGGAAETGRPRNEKRKQPSLSVTCLHSLTSSEAREASSVVIQSLYQCTMDTAKTLVRDGHARHADFCIFVGYAGWYVASHPEYMYTHYIYAFMEHIVAVVVIIISVLSSMRRMGND